MDSWAPPSLELSLSRKHRQVTLSLSFITYNKENNNNSNYSRHPELLWGRSETARAAREISIGHVVSPRSNWSSRAHPPFVLSSLTPFLFSSPLHLHPFLHPFSPSFLLFFFFNFPKSLNHPRCLKLRALASCWLPLEWGGAGKAVLGSCRVWRGSR